MIGIAVRQRAILDLDQQLLEFFPEHAAAVEDPRKQAITLGHMLSMTSGFDEAASDVDILRRSDDVVGTALERPMAHDPGERFFYDEVSTHLLSVLLTRLTGTSAAVFAHTALFRPLGIWADERVRFGLHMTARELAKLGYLYVNGGPPVGRPHGYLWWMPEPHRAFFAAGLGGQTLHVVPALDLVTVFTTRSSDRAAEHRSQVLENFVIPAIRDG